jgi:transcriptional regulator with XRE-family HTH domain
MLSAEGMGKEGETGMALSRTQEEALSLLFGEERLPQQEIAARLGIAESTLSKWINGLNGPSSREFEAEYERRLSQIAGQCRRRLRKLGMEAVTTLEHVMTGSYGPRMVGVAKARLDAAESVLDRIGVPKSSKVEIGTLSDEELEAEIERRIAERGLAAEGEGPPAGAEAAGAG